MSLIFVTGVSGSGKSAVANELKARGYEAYDVDDALARWRNTESGFVHPKSSVKADQRTPEFLETTEWVVPRESLEPLAESCRDKVAFICGAIANEDELRDLFDVSVGLELDADSLGRRLDERTNNDWGKSPHEREQTIGWNDFINERHRQYGRRVIDATRPLEQVVDEIAAIASELLAPTQHQG